MGILTRDGSEAPNSVGDIKGGTPSEALSTETTDTATVITANSTTIRTVEDLLRVAKVDLAIWEVEKSWVNKWDCVAKTRTSQVAPKDWKSELTATELYQVKVMLRRKVAKITENAVNALLDRIIKKAPLYTQLPRPKKRPENFMLEISPFDAHFGKLAWMQETGNNYDLKIAEQVFQRAVQELLHRTVTFNISKILIPIGQDFFHINDPANTTVNGTPQDVDGRFSKVYTTGCQAMIRAIEEARKRAPVELLYVPGNHDRLSSWHMAEMLKAWFRNAKDVVVDSAPTTRKYRQYGVNLLGFSHGDEENPSDLSKLMPIEAKDLWGKTQHHEWHLGHFHKKKKVEFMFEDTQTGGTIVRWLPSLSGTDSWHYRKGYVHGRRSAEAYLWSDIRGYTGHFSANVLDGEE